MVPCCPRPWASTGIRSTEYSYQYGFRAAPRPGNQQHSWCLRCTFLRRRGFLAAVEHVLEDQAGIRVGLRRLFLEPLGGLVVAAGPLLGRQLTRQYRLLAEGPDGRPQ